MKRPQYFVAIAAGCAALLSGVAFAGQTGSAPVSDATLTQRVMGKLTDDDPEVAHMIQVSSRNGIVTLSGVAYNPMDAAKVIRDAESVEGVIKVKNHMSVRD